MLKQKMLNERNNIKGRTKIMASSDHGIKNFNLEEFTQYVTGAFNASDITKVDRIKAAICGEPKSGKSKLIADTARKPLYHCDFDDRQESIAGAKNTVIKQYLDPDAMDPHGWNSLESDISTFEWLKKEDKLPFRSLALDSMTFLRQLAENQMMKDTNMFRAYKVGTTKYPIAQGWDAVVEVQKMLQTLLARVFALGIDIYVTFHTQNEKDKQKSTKEETVYTDRLTVSPQNLAMLLPKFNETWRTFIDSDNSFKVQTRQDWRFNAATALHIDGVENPNIEEMIAKHEKNVFEGK
jgi:hypothetical protein